MFNLSEFFKILFMSFSLYEIDGLMLQFYNPSVDTV